MVYNWESYKDIIHQLYITEEKSWTELRVILTENHGFTPSRAAFYQAIKAWNFEAKRTPPFKDDVLVSRVKELWHYNLGHQEILYILREHDYPELTSRRLKELRLQHRFLLTNRGDAHVHAQRLAEEYVQKHLKSGQGARYGIIYTHANIRLSEHTFVSQHQVREALKTVDPVGVQARTRQLHRQRGRYMVKGPNRVWSVDGHDKLADFEFEIYGFLDAYSRFILGVYVGVSKRTAVSVQKQYLEIVNRHGFPKLVRSDMGTETGLMAQTQVLLRREQKPNLEFRKAYAYGTSTKNQRIEAWWNLLTTGQTEQWKILFETYRETGLFDGSKWDKIALQFLYMPVIRHHIHRFVWIHNYHAIRKQRNREFYLPTGKPYKMYYHPPTHVRNYSARPDPALWEQLSNSLQSYDMDAYLTEETMALCVQLLEVGNYPIQFDFGGTDDTHQQAYAYLRTALYVYEQNHGIITEVERPLGAGDWITQHMEQDSTLDGDINEQSILGLRPIVEDVQQDYAIASGEGLPISEGEARNWEVLEWPAYDDGLGDLDDDGLLLSI